MVISSVRYRKQLQFSWSSLHRSNCSSHSRYRVSTAFTLGEQGHRTEVVKDDFQAQWKDLEVVSDNPEYRTYYGKLNYLQILERDHPLVMRPGQQYRLALSFEPDLAFADE